MNITAVASNSIEYCEIVVTPDHNYAGPCAAMLVSLMRSASRPSALRINLIRDASLTNRDIEGLSQIILSYGAKLRLVVVDGAVAEQIPATSRYPAATWYRLFLGSLLLDISRVIYLDSDMIVRDDIADLWDLSLDGKVICAATHPLLPHVDRRRIRRLGVTELKNYFNTGVMIIDLDRFRAVESDLLACLANPPASLDFADQDVYNAVLGAQRKPLDSRWNLQMGHLEGPSACVAVNRAEVLAAREQPGIVHFTGTIKPWSARSRHPYRFEFWECLKMTDWANMPLQRNDLLNRTLKYVPTWVVPFFRSAIKRELTWWITSFLGAKK